MSGKEISGPPNGKATAAVYPVRCRCGTLKGVLRNLPNARRAICYCYDCQAFAHALGDPGYILDSRGGSDVIQTLPKNLTFTAGSDRLACLRLTDKGLLRWYADCCRTPIGNTLTTPKLSFVGLLHVCLDSTEMSLDEAFGPIGIRVYTRGAKGEPKPQEVGKGKAVGWFIGTVLKARFNGDYKRTPLFHSDTGTPVATPRVLSNAELTNVMAAVRNPI
jgi:uncharacterized protein DUF6151